MVRELRHVEEVGRDARHDLPHLRIVEVRERELLQVGEEVAAHVRLDLRAHDVADGGHEKRGAHIDELQEHVEQADAQDVLDREPREIVDAHIRELLDDERQRELAHRRQRRAEEIENQNPFVLDEIRREAADEPLLPFLLLCLFQR